MVVGLFSLLRYTPDIARGEFVNVGAIAVFPDLGYVVYDLREIQRRARCLWQAHKSGEVEGVGVLLTEMIDAKSAHAYDPHRRALVVVPTASEEFLVELKRRTAMGVIRLGEIGKVEFEADTLSEDDAKTFLGDLVRRYVEDASPLSTEAQGRRPTLFKEVQSDLKKRHLLGTKLDDRKVVVRQPIAGLEWKYDFLLQVNRLEVIETLDLQPMPLEKGTPAYRTTGYKYMKLSEAKRLFPGNIAAYLIFKADEEQAKLFAPDLRILSNYAELINYDDMAKKRELFDHLEEAIIGNRLG